MHTNFLIVSGRESPLDIIHRGGVQVLLDVVERVLGLLHTYMFITIWKMKSALLSAVQDCDCIRVWCINVCKYVCGYVPRRRLWGSCASTQCRHNLGLVRLLAPTALSMCSYLMHTYIHTYIHSNKYWNENVNSSFTGSVGSHHGNSACQTHFVYIKLAQVPCMYVCMYVKYMWKPLTPTFVSCGTERPGYVYVQFSIFNTDLTHVCTYVCVNMYGMQGNRPQREWGIV